VDVLWGKAIRLLFSASTIISSLKFNDNVCTLVMPIPGSPLNNFTTKDNEGDMAKNVTRFSVILRLTAPENETVIYNYLQNLTSVTSVRVFSIASKGRGFFGSPGYLPRSLITGELDDENAVRLYHSLINRVYEELYLSYPSAQILQVDETIPWMGYINYTYGGGYTCINTSSDCQGAQVDATYMRSSRLLNFSSASHHIITIGAIHHDFMDPSFYSSMCLYKLNSHDDVSSGSGVLSWIDNEQRGSALGYYDGKGDENSKSLLKKFYVVQTGYTCLERLPLTTRCKNLSQDEVELNSIVFMLGRTYASPGPDPVSLFPDIVLDVVLPSPNDVISVV